MYRWMYSEGIGVFLYASKSLVEIYVHLRLLTLDNVFCSVKR